MSTSAKGGKVNNLTLKNSRDHERKSNSSDVESEKYRIFFNFRALNDALVREIFRFFSRALFARVAPKRRQRRAKKYQYQFQLRRNSIISAEGILAHFGCRPQRASTSISRLWKKLWVHRVIDPSPSIGGSIGVCLHRATGRFKSTRPDLRVASYTQRA